MAWDYQKIDTDGRLCSYYNKHQSWDTSAGRIEVQHITATPGGVQYYLISIDGKLNSRYISAARLHYILHTKNAVDVWKGIPQELSLLIEEVEAWARRPRDDDVEFCPYCLDKGVIGNEICSCAQERKAEIKEYNRRRRLAALKKLI